MKKSKGKVKVIDKIAQYNYGLSHGVDGLSIYMYTGWLNGLKRKWAPRMIRPVCSTAHLWLPSAVNEDVQAQLL